ncbi:hypothetical protein Tco_1516540 [Tanacetum coccineum]
METNDTLSSCSDLDEQEIQQLQKQEKILKENSLSKLNALQTTIQHLSSSNYSMYYEFRDAFHRLFEADERTFKSVLSRNMQNLERQLDKETLHEKDSNSDLSVIKVQFDQFIHSKVLEPSNYNSYDLETRRDFKDYTQMEPQTFKEAIIQNIDSIEQCIVERASSDASSGEKDSSGIVSDKGNDQGLENQSNTFGDESNRSRNECNDKSTSRDDTDIRPSYDTEPMVEVPYTAEYNVFAVDTQHSEQPECIINTCVVEKVDSNVIPDSPDMCDNEIQTDQNVVECDDERVVLANLIANLKLDVDENKKIQKQLKKANTSLAHELKECKSILAKTSRTLGESNSIRDSCLIALQNKQTELETYKTLNDRTVDYDKLEHKLNETLGLLAQKEIDIKEGLKLKAYEISVVKEKHDELVKQSLLTKSHYEGLVKEKTKVITDLKLKEEKDIDKMISMEKQLKFLNEIVYKRNQSIQTIHMLAPKGPTFNGRPTFANPMYLKKAQSEKPCLYEIPYDKSDPANRLVPDREETLTLEKESRSKLNKDLVRPYDYTKLNSLYEIFKPATQEYHEQLAHANENDSFTFFHELKHEMHADLNYIESREKEIDELEYDTAEFSNMYDILLQECVSNDVMCSYLHSLSDLDAHTELQCLYLHKVKECECLAQKLSKQTETVKQMKNDTVCKEKASNVFLKEREQYFEIQDLKAQLQDKNIAIIGVSHDLTKPVTPHSWPQVRKLTFAKPYDVNACGPSRKSPKHVSFQSPRESVGSNDMVHNYYLEEAKKKAQLQKDKALNTKPSVQQSARLPNTANDENKGIMPTKIELTLKQSQQGVSNDVLVSIEGVEEWKRNDSPAEETETESNVWDDGSENVNPFGDGNPLLTKKTESEPNVWDIGDEEEEFLFVNKYPSFQEEPIVLVEEESCPVYDTDNEEEESMSVYDTDIEDVIEEEEGFVGKGGFGGEEDNIEDVVVVANDLCS